MPKRDAYETLGIGRNADEKEIKQAYYKLAKEYHPDKNPDSKEEATEKFKEIQSAYEALKDPQSRSKYDQFGWDGMNGAGGFDPRNAGFGFGSFEDIVEEIFGRHSVFDDFLGGRTRRRSSARPGNDLRRDVEITLEEAVSGKKMTIEVPTLQACSTCHGSGAKPGSSPQTCPTCSGRGQVQHRAGFFITSRPCPACRGEGVVISDPCNICRGQGRVPHTSELSIEILPGASDGLILRYSGAGEAGIKGGLPGDLHIVIHVREHPIFQRRGDDLICEANISYTQAALGSEIDIPVINGKAKMNIPPGTQSGKVFSLRGKGVPHLRGRRGAGDQLVRIIVDVPTKLTPKEEALLRKIAEIRGEEVAPPDKGFFRKVKETFI